MTLVITTPIALAITAPCTTLNGAAPVTLTTTSIHTATTAVAMARTPMITTGKFRLKKYFSIK